MMPPGFRFDLHVHSEHSRDGLGTVLEMALASQAAGLHGFALTDHDTASGHDEIAAAAETTRQIIIPGVEATTSAGHVLLLGVDAAPPRGITVGEACELADASGGVAIPAHPLRMLSGLGPSEIARGGFPAAEGFNGRDRPLVRDNTVRVLARSGLPMTGGSDAHRPQDVAACWTLIRGPVTSVPQLLDALRRGDCRPEGGHIPQKQIWRERLARMRQPVSARTKS